MTSTSTSDRTRIFEIAAVIVTALGKFVFMDYLDARLPFIVAVIIFLGAYIIYRKKKNPGIVKYWGFRTDNFMKTIRIITPFGLIAVVLFICIGFYRQTINFTWHIIPILFLYPIWGIIQQFLLIALTAGNLQDLEHSKIPKPIVIILAAALFGLIHYPFLWLMIGSFVLAIFYGMIYLRSRNVYALGIFHGLLGGLFFYTVVNRDPFIEMFGHLLNITK